MNYLFSKFIYLPLTETFKNCTITYSHNNCHSLRWYEWDLLVFCKQTPFQLGAIGTLTPCNTFLTFNKFKRGSFWKYCEDYKKMLITSIFCISRHVFHGKSGNRQHGYVA